MTLSGRGLMAASSLLVLGLLLAAYPGPACAQLAVFQTFTGQISLMTNGIGSQDNADHPLAVQVPPVAGYSLLKAFAFYTSTFGQGAIFWVNEVALPATGPATCRTSSGIDWYNNAYDVTRYIQGPCAAMHTTVPDTYRALVQDEGWRDRGLNGHEGPCGAGGWIWSMPGGPTSQPLQKVRFRAVS